MVKPLRIDVPNCIFVEKGASGDIHLNKGYHDENIIDEFELLYTEHDDGRSYLLNPKHVIQSVALNDEVKQVIVFIHGHNCTRAEAYSHFEEMIPQISERFGAELRSQTKYLCVTWSARCNDSMVPWCLKGLWRTVTEPLGCLGYVEDLDRITYATTGITYLLNAIARKGKRVHIIAHSMGCQAVINYLSQLSIYQYVLTRPFFLGRGDTQSESRKAIITRIVRNIGSVALLAPDVPTHRIKSFFREHYPSFWNNGGLERFAFISNNYDLPIRASEWLRLGSSRAGIPDNILPCLEVLKGVKLTKPLDEDTTPVPLYDLREWRVLGHGLYKNSKALERIAEAILDAVKGQPASDLGPGEEDDEWQMFEGSDDQTKKKDEEVAPLQASSGLRQRPLVRRVLRRSTVPAKVIEIEEKQCPYKYVPL